MSDLIKPLSAPAKRASKTERIERFQALSAGQYWRASAAIPEQGIDAGEVLLIQSIRWVDSTPHTVILRPHPTKIGRYFPVETVDSTGERQTRHLRYDEHRFLLEEFLASFEYEPDHQRVRTDELKAVQDRVSALQHELLDAQRDPKQMALIVEAGLEAAAEKADTSEAADGERVEAHAAVPDSRENATLPVVPEKAISLATGTVAGAIEAGLTEEGVAQVKAAAEREHQIATIKAKWIEGKTQTIAETIGAMTPFYEEQAAAALAQTEDVRTYVAKLTEGIESLDLYVGKGVTVETLRTGTSAPVTEPLTFMQRKLLMDEELAVWADVDETFDFRREKTFFAALENMSLVEQIFPTPRCVVVMAVTRRDLDYGDTLTNAVVNKENRKVFLLVRNGENVHRVFSPVESHLGAARLFPSKDEQDRIFRGIDGREMKFDDVAYTDKLAEHERHALHYKRFLLLACGLDHRLGLFGTFYEGPPSMDFVSLEFQERSCRFLHDDDDRLLGEGHKPLNAWIAEKNAYLRSGSRVICNWRELLNPSTAPAACFRDSRGESFERRYRPAHEHDVKIAHREGGDLCVQVEVTGSLRRSIGDRTFNCKVNLSKFRDGYWDYTELPFLCLDAVDPEELERYIKSREARRNHLAYIRFFKRALKHLVEERAAERATRDRLIRALASGRLATGSEADAIVSQAVIAWRAAHRGLPLPTPEAGESSAEWKSLLDQMYLVARSDTDAVAEIEAFMREKGLTPLRLVVNGASKRIVYAAPAAEERDDRLIPHTWVHAITLERGKRKLKERSRRWALLPQQAASETTLHEWPQAGEWVRDPAPFSSFKQKQAILAIPGEFEAKLARHTKPLDEEEYEAQLKAWRELRRDLMKRSRHVCNPELAIPIGVVFCGSRRRPYFVCVGARTPHALLYRRAPTDTARKRLRDEFVNAYARKDAGERIFDEALSSDGAWQLRELPLSARVSADGFLGRDVFAQSLDARPSCDPRLAVWLNAWRAELEDSCQVWLAPELFDSTGACVLDKLLGIEVPADFEPLDVVEIELSSADEDEELPPHCHWIDISRRSSDADAEEARRPLFQRQRTANIPEGYSYSSRHYIEPSRSDARAFVRRQAAEAQLRAVRDTDLPGALSAPSGYERWYLIEP